MRSRIKFFISLVFIFALIFLSVKYFRSHNVAVLNPAGPVAHKERQLLFIGLLLSSIVVIPVFTLLFFFAWKYKESNHSARYSPDWDHNRFMESIWWLIPSALILIISIITWNSSHDLDPYKRLASQQSPMVIKVVALDWKWLFLYPEQNIASVNFVEFPVSTPITFEITADAPMNSFWIPQLGGQIYAMPGMSTELHLLADKVGNFNGSSANISGKGFSGMNFTARASSNTDFNNWVHGVQSSPLSLNTASYSQLAQPSQHNAVAYYASAQPNLYDMIRNKYMAPGDTMSDMSMMEAQ